MKIRTRITATARSRGFTAAEVARRLGGYRSNVSAMDAGRRAASLNALGRIATVLGCGPAELLEEVEDDRPVFRRPSLNARLAAWDAQLVDGVERGWTHRVLLAWQRHYRSRR